MSAAEKQSFTLLPETERWLHDEVGPVHDAMKADPVRGIPAAEVFAEIRLRHARRRQEAT